MNYTDYAIDLIVESEFPQAIQKLIEEFNVLYDEIDHEEGDIEESIESELVLKRRNIQKMGQIRNELEKILMESIESLKGIVEKLENEEDDSLLNLKETQQNELLVVISKYKHLILGKTASLNKLLQELSKGIIESQQIESLTGPVNVDIESKQQEKLNLIDNELARHEEDLDKDQQDIRHIHEQVNEIVGIIDTISGEVQEEGNTVNKIDVKVTEADEDMDEGLENLLKAEKAQKAGTKAKLILVIVAAIAVVLVVVLLLAFLL